MVLLHSVLGILPFGYRRRRQKQKKGGYKTRLVSMAPFRSLWSCILLVVQRQNDRRVQQGTRRYCLRPDKINGHWNTRGPMAAAAAAAAAALVLSRSKLPVSVFYYLFLFS